MDDLSQADTAQGYPDDPLELIYHLLPDGMTLTDKGAPCMDGSGSACLDLFSQVSARPPHGYRGVGGAF
jgi:hypothetical protein